MSALEYYSKVLKHSHQLVGDEDKIPIPAVEDLFVIVHANLAQVLLNLGEWM